VRSLKARKLIIVQKAHLHIAMNLSLIPLPVNKKKSPPCKGEKVASMYPRESYSDCTAMRGVQYPQRTDWSPLTKLQELADTSRKEALVGSFTYVVISTSLLSK